MKHSFIVTIEIDANKRDAADYVRNALLLRHARYHKHHTVKPVKPWGGNVKPAKVSVRRLKNDWFQIYVSGRRLGEEHASLARARQFLRSRHPSLAKSADYSRA